MTCECTQPGFCQSLNREMAVGHWLQCQSNPKFKERLLTLKPIARSETIDEHEKKRRQAFIEQLQNNKQLEAAKPRIELPCIYRSETPIEWAGCGCHIFDCEIHDRCVPWRKPKLKEGIKVCDECHQRIESLPPPVDTVETDSYHALRSTLPHGVPTDAAIQTALRAVSQRRTAMPSTMAGRGIVFAAGGWRFMCGVFVSVRMLRWLGCEYPVEVWYNGDFPGEYDSDYERIFDGLNVTFRDAAAELRRLGIARRSSLGGWPLKPLAYLLSSFAEVLGLDADCYPVLDVRPLFDAPGYVQRGAILWPDRGGQHGAPLEPGQWKRFGLEPRQTPGIESGQVLIDKRKHWHSLAVVTWLNDHHDYCYLPHGPAGLYGDKDTFAIGFHAADEWGGNKTGAPYLQAPPTRWLHTAFMQHAPDGSTMFIHRCRDKPRVERHNYGTSQRDKDKMIRCDHAGGKSPPFAHEWKVFDLVDEYRRAIKGKREIDRHVELQNRFIETIPPPPILDGRGVLTMTSPAYWPGTYVLLKMLDHVGCRLPVQVWLRPNEGVPTWLSEFSSVTVREFADAKFETYHRIEAIIQSGWKELLFIDSDAYPLFDPTPCLDDLHDNGFITWQDHPDGDVFFPELYGLPPSARDDTFAPQNAIMVVDVEKSWRVLQLVNYFCHDQDFYFPGQLMDQAQFRAAWAILKCPPKRYHQGRVWWDERLPFYHIHQWRDGTTPFVVHRGSCKFGLDGVFLRPPIRLPGVPLDDVMWEFFEEYKKRIR